MNPMRASFLAVSLVAFLPVAALLSGCGGGSDSSSFPSPTPTATPTLGPFLSAPIDFGNGQSGTLTLRTQGILVNGSVQVTAPAVPGNNTRIITPGIYPVVGNIASSPGVTFLVTGRFPEPTGVFTVQGIFPTTTQNGSYTLVIGTSTDNPSQTITGVYPRVGSLAAPTS